MKGWENLLFELVSEGVKILLLCGRIFQVASITLSYNRLTQASHEQALFDWLWEAALSLRLHAADLPAAAQQIAAAGGHDQGEVAM